LRTLDSTFEFFFGQALGKETRSSVVPQNHSTFRVHPRFPPRPPKRPLFFNTFRFPAYLLVISTPVSLPFPRNFFLKRSLRDKAAVVPRFLLFPVPTILGSCGLTLYLFMRIPPPLRSIPPVRQASSFFPHRPPLTVYPLTELPLPFFLFPNFGLTPLSFLPRLPPTRGTFQKPQFTPCFSFLLNLRALLRP